MKKSILFIATISVFFLTGCGEISQSQMKKKEYVLIIQDFTDKVCDSFYAGFATDEVVKYYTKGATNVDHLADTTNSAECIDYPKANDAHKCKLVHFLGFGSYKLGSTACVIGFDGNASFKK